MSKTKEHSFNPLLVKQAATLLEPYKNSQTGCIDWQQAKVDSLAGKFDPVFYEKITSLPFLSQQKIGITSTQEEVVVAQIKQAANQLSVIMYQCLIQESLSLTQATADEPFTNS